MVGSANGADTGTMVSSIISSVLAGAAIGLTAGGPAGAAAGVLAGGLSGLAGIEGSKDDAYKSWYQGLYEDAGGVTDASLAAEGMLASAREKDKISFVTLFGDEGAAGGLPLCRETDWDFETNTPVWRGGNPVFVTGGRAVLVWAWNALHTERFACDVFRSGYGLDLGDLLGRTCTEEVRRSEAVRETLLVNPYILDVSQVSVDLDRKSTRLNSSH